jgi:hypothetical protein
MQTNIFVLNQYPLGVINPVRLKEKILEANFATLCEQYGLDPGQINATRSNLEVIVSQGPAVPYFLLTYGESHSRPIVVNEWDVQTKNGNKLLKDLLTFYPNPSFNQRLSAGVHIVSIEMDSVQVQGMDLLLAYEIARWAAARGDGVVLGLDGVWYYLNTHHAFIPVK